MSTVNPRLSSQTHILVESDAVQEGLRLGGVGVWRWKVDSDDLYWSPNLEDVHHLPAGSFDGSLWSFRRDIHPDDAEAVWQKISASIGSGAPYSAVYRTAPRLDTEALWIETSGGMMTAPDGTRYLTGICLDVSTRVRGEHELQRRLNQQRAVARFGTFALAERDFQRILDEAVRIAADVLNVPLTKILKLSDAAEHLDLKAGLGWADGLVGHACVGIEKDSQAGFTLLAREPVIVSDLSAETRFNGPKLLHDHGVRSGISVIIPGAETRPFGVFGIHSRDLRQFDQTDAEFLLSLANIVATAERQVAAADHHLLLVREMAHRAGNMLQLVNSIANQTFSAESDPALARKSFSERLNSLARANHVVARGGWTSTRFVALVEESLQPFGRRIVAKGRDILLPPDFCFDMGLLLHELATNSVKYGSLGTNDDTIDLTWNLDRRTDGSGVFRIAWDDPASKSPGSQGRGFGSKLMSALVERKWNGSITTSNERGFKFAAEIPLESPLRGSGSV